MPHVYVATPAEVTEDFLPPGWDPTWPWEDENSPEPPGYNPGSPVLYAHNEEEIPPTYRIVYRVGMNSDYGGISGTIVRQQGAHAFPLQVSYAEDQAPAAKADITVSWIYKEDGSQEEHGSQVASTDGFECEVSQTDDYVFEITITEMLDGYSYVFAAECSKYSGTKTVYSFEAGDGYWYWAHRNPPFATRPEALADYDEWWNTYGLPHPSYEVRYARWSENFEWVFDAWAESFEDPIDPPTWTVTVYRTTYRVVGGETVGTEAELCSYEIVPPAAGTFNPDEISPGVIIAYDEEAEQFTSKPWLGIMKTSRGLSILGQQYTGGNKYSYRTIPYLTLNFAT